MLPSPPSQGSILIQLRRHSLLCVLVVESGSINLLLSLRIREQITKVKCFLDFFQTENVTFKTLFAGTDQTM